MNWRLGERGPLGGTLSPKASRGLFSWSCFAQLKQRRWRQVALCYWAPRPLQFRRRQILQFQRGPFSPAVRLLVGMSMPFCAHDWEADTAVERLRVEQFSMDFTNCQVAESSLIQASGDLAMEGLIGWWL